MLALLVLHRTKLLASNQSILALGVAPRQVAGTPVPVFTPGTDAGGVCTRALHDAKPTKHTQPFTGERGLWFRQGCRDRTPKGFMQGRIQVVEQSRCRTHRQQTTTIAETQSHQSVLKGIGIINQKLISKTDFFYNLQNFFTEIFILIFSLPDSMRIRFYG